MSFSFFNLLFYLYLSIFVLFLIDIYIHISFFFIKYNNGSFIIGNFASIFKQKNTSELKIYLELKDQFSSLFIQFDSEIP